MITPDIKTTATDVKFFAKEFTLQANTGTYSGFSEGVFDLYRSLGNPIADDKIGTGKATSGEALGYSGNTYYYINAIQNDKADYISGTSEQLYATIFMKPDGTNTSGTLDYYYLGARINFDDSNVASGTQAASWDEYTQYEDDLDLVMGTGLYQFSGDTNTIYRCQFNPYIEAGRKYESKLGSNLINVEPNAAVNKDTNSFTDLTAFDLITSATQYSGTIVHRAGSGMTETVWNTTWSREIWTNTAVIITITGNNYFLNWTSTNDINIDTTTIDGYSYVSLVNGDVRSGTHTISVEGNVETGVTFHNRIGNTGTYYASGSDNYADQFMIDVFRYDTTDPIISTATILTGDGYAFVSLTASSSAGASNATSGRHASRTDDDDRFRIIGFSGVNTTSYNYDTTTGYNADLNAIYVDATSQNFTMERTGYTYTTLDNFDTNTGSIKFKESREGYILVSDIAGNTTGVRVDIDVEPKTTFTIITKHAFRATAADLSMTGDIRLGRYDTEATNERIFTHNSINDNDAKVAIGVGGTGTVDMVTPASGKAFFVVFKGSGTLAVGFTGTWTNDITSGDTNIFDFTLSGNNRGDASELFPYYYYSNEEYIIPGDVSSSTGGSYDIINAGDLVTVNGSLTIGAFSEPYRMDFDINDTINAIEQAIVIQYNGEFGWIDKFAWQTAAGGGTFPVETGFNNTL